MAGQDPIGSPRSPHDLLHKRLLHLVDVTVVDRGRRR